MNVRLWFALAAAALAMPACKSCNAPPTKEPVKAEGDPCMTDLECETGLCFGLQGQASVCKRKCTAGCTKQEVCTQIDLNRYGCVPAREGLCKACQTNADCPYAADICISVGGVKVCGRDCSFDNACPESYHCIPGKTAEGSEVAAQCQPNSGTCGCTALSVGQHITCENTNDAGTCLGSSTCELTGYSACTALVPSVEVCNGKDDNCNSKVDEDLGETSCGVGECKRTFANCVNGLPQTCVPGTPAIDICNEKDDNCDGVIDDGIDKNSLQFCGTCTNSCTAANGTPKCSSGTCSVDSCTAPFKDCDAVYSNGCEVNTNTSLLHCGGCAKPCAAANATPLCSTGVCTFTCLPGFGDVDKLASNGCEATCTNTDAPELGFLDTNCDGIDGNESVAIFVDTLGGASGNPGTKALPKKTISEGIAAAQAGGKKDVYVSQGIYSEMVTLVSGISLYGSYNAAAGWTRAVSNLTLILSTSSVGIRGANLAAPTTVQLFSVNALAATGNGLSSVGVFITDSNGGVTLTGLTISNGNGSAGLDGADGATPASGQPGGPASGTNRGNGGFSSCGATGGYGGFGVSGTTGGQQGGTGTQAAGGGFGATGGNPGGGGSCSLTSATNGGAAPAVGQNGQPGSGGIGGTASAPIGALNVASLYLAPQGGQGGNGTPGGGGGGGGSGGGTQHGSGFLCTGCSDNDSGGGGGGGGGGCGGFGGLGGRGGGGSFGVASINSVVTIEGTKLTTGNGGKGGDGGDGSTGAIGGPPGSGAPGEATTSCSDKTGGSGANGSTGGQGGRGGGGAGGPGGPSICVFYKGAVPNTTGLNCTNGIPGLGGAGGSGFQAAQAGPAGQSGAVVVSN